MIEDCKFFTMFGVNDDPTDHMKCLLFKTCDPLEACDDCITGTYLYRTVLFIPKEVPSVKLFVVMSARLSNKPERTKQMEQILNFQVPAEGLELVILLYTQY